MTTSTPISVAPSVPPADGAAAAALRDALAALPGRATVVIGEGEKDDAPMLFAGEELGTVPGSPP